MFLQFAVAFLFATSTLASLAPTMTTRQEHSLNPPLTALVKPNSVSYLPTIVNRHSRSNAHRMAHGLKPNPPARRRQPNAPRAQPSPGAASTAGYVEGMDEDTGEPMGFVGSSFNLFGQYGLTESEDPAHRSIINIHLGRAAKSSVNIRVNNAPNPDYDTLGGVTGYSSDSDDFAPDSNSYAYLAGTGETQAEDPPTAMGNSFTCNTGLVQRAESAIFKYDPITRLISAHWVNGDSSQPVTHIGYNKGENVIILTGDRDTFTAAYGPTQWLKLRFVPIQN